MNIETLDMVLKIVSSVRNIKLEKWKVTDSFFWMPGQSEKCVKNDGTFLDGIALRKVIIYKAVLRSIQQHISKFWINLHKRTSINIKYLLNADDKKLHSLLRLAANISVMQRGRRLIQKGLSLLRDRLKRRNEGAIHNELFGNIIWDEDVGALPSKWTRRSLPRKDPWLLSSWGQMLINEVEECISFWFYIWLTNWISIIPLYTFI
jgi:hypothetical protein